MYCIQCGRKVLHNRKDGFCSPTCQEDCYFDIESGYMPTVLLGSAVEVEIKNNKLVLKTA